MKPLFYLFFIGFCVFSCTSAQNVTHISIEHYKHQSDNVLIDVRTPQEFAQGHLPEALNIDVKSNDFQQQFEQFDKNRPIYLYCRSGKRSLQAAKKLEAEGFKYIYNLEGGFSRWQDKQVNKILK